MSLAALPAARRPALALAVAAVAALLWHLLLPAGFYRNPAVFLEGPFPALVGAGFGVWLHPDDDTVTRFLAACFWAVAAIFLAILVLGTVYFGLLPALNADYLLLRNGFRLPFLAMFDRARGGSAVYFLWSGIKTLMLWGAVAYVIQLARHSETRGRLAGAFASLGEQQAFGREKNRQAREYRRLYLEALRAGQSPPTPPPILQAQLAGSDWGGRARLAYWGLRIGIAVAGALGLYAVFQERLVDSFMSAFLRGLWGG